MTRSRKKIAIVAGEAVHAIAKELWRVNLTFGLRDLNDYFYLSRLLRARQLLRERQVYHRRMVLCASWDFEGRYWEAWQFKANCELEAVLAEIEHMEDGECSG